MTLGRTPVVLFKRSWRSLLIEFAVATVISVIGFGLTRRFPELNLEIELPLGEQGVLIHLPVFLLISLFLFVRPLVMLVDAHYEVSEHHLRVFRGKLSLTRKMEEFAFEDLIGVQVSQSILDRLLRIGSIRVGSRTPHIEILMRGVPHPQRYAELISRRIDAARVKGRE